MSPPAARLAIAAPQAPISRTYAIGAVTYNYTGTSSGTDAYVGGLIGYNGGGSSSVSGSFAANGAVTAQYGTGGSGSMPAFVGGLIGNNNTTLSNSYATSNVSNTISSGTQYTGGLIGKNSAGTVSDTYSTGYVSASSGTTGGLVTSNAGTVSASYWDK